MGSAETRLSRLVAKWERQQLKSAEKRKAKRLYDEAWAKVSALVKVRDKQTCRVCSCQTTRWGVGDPRLWGQSHHIQYRSAGGPDELWNLVWICNVCSDKEHRHLIRISGTAEALEIEHGQATARICQAH